MKKLYISIPLLVISVLASSAFGFKPSLSGGLGGSKGGGATEWVLPEMPYPLNLLKGPSDKVDAAIYYSKAAHVISKKSREQAYGAMEEFAKLMDMKVNFETSKERAKALGKLEEAENMDMSPELLEALKNAQLEVLASKKNLAGVVAVSAKLVTAIKGAKDELSENKMKNMGKLKDVAGATKDIAGTAQNAPKALEYITKLSMRLKAIYEAKGLKDPDPAEVEAKAKESVETTIDEEGWGN